MLQLEAAFRLAMESVPLKFSGCASFLHMTENSNNIQLNMQSNFHPMRSTFNNTNNGGLEPLMVYNPHVVRSAIENTEDGCKADFTGTKDSDLVTQ